MSKKYLYDFEWKCLPGSKMSWLCNQWPVKSFFKDKTMSYMLIIVSVSVSHKVIIIKRKHIQQIVIFIGILVTASYKLNIWHCGFSPVTTKRHRKHFSFFVVLFYIILSLKYQLLKKSYCPWNSACHFKWW